VLVIVLVTVLFASAALVAFIEKASDNLIVDARETIAKRLRQDAYSSLEVVLAVLEDFRLTNGALRSPAEGWDDPLGFAGWAPRDGCTVEVSFEDESGKMSLVNADPAAMLDLFEAWGLPQRDAEKLRDSLLSWMRKDYVAPTTSADYEHAVLPYHAPNRSLRSYAELAAIDEPRKVFFDEAGRPNEAFQKFAAAFSLFNFKQVNINGARREAVDSLTWIDPAQRQRFMDYLHGTGDRARSGPGYFENPADAARVVGVPSLPGWMGTEISALRVNVLVRDGGTSFRVSAVVAPSGGATVVDPATSDSSGENAAKNNAANPTPTSSSGTSATAKKLNYPFTLLEITENAVISTVPAAPKA
jgi:general secretion pathway protein K